MSSIDDARRSLDRAQGLLDRSSGDIARFDEFLGWLDGAIARVHEVEAYARDQGPADLAAVLADDQAAVTPSVVNEDAPRRTSTTGCCACFGSSRPSSRRGSTPGVADRRHADGHGGSRLMRSNAPSKPRISSTAGRRRRRGWRAA